ncbi:MAG: hypothetical protein ACTSQP_00425 [Promethearchaeota archaeon]
MEEILKIIGNFLESLRTEIREYYDRVYSYINDLFVDKGIDLKFKTAYESEKTINNTLDSMIKTVRLALQTIGMPRQELKVAEEHFKKAIQKRDPQEYPDYNTYFEKDIKIYTDKFLFKFLVEYLIDYDFTKIENLDLFDLLPRKFIEQLDNFKDNFITSTTTKRIIKDSIDDIENYIDFQAFAIKGVTTEVKKLEKIEEKITKKPITKPSEIKVEKKKVEIPQIEKIEVKKPEIEKLKEEIKTPSIDIEALKASIKKSAIITSKEPKKEIRKEKIIEEIKEKAQKEVIKEEKPIAEVPEPTISKPPPPIEPPSVELPQKKEILSVQSSMSTTEVSPPKIPQKEESKYPIIDDIGALNHIKPTVLSKFKINKENLIDVHKNLNNFFTLESLYYYISALKLMNINIPFSNDQIKEFLKNYVNNGVFSISKEDPPDPISVYYGLSIMSETGIFNDVDFIDLLDIEIFLESELKQFIPEKLHLNLYTILGLKVLERNGGIIADKSNLITEIMNLNLYDLEQYNPTLDILEQLLLIKILNKSADLQHFSGLYAEEIKKLINSENGSVKDTITDTARALLIFTLLDLHKKEFTITQKLLNYISSATEFFGLEEIDERFNWKNDKLGLLVEIRMLYWALLASASFNVII